MPTYYLADANLNGFEELAVTAPSTLDEAQGWVVNKKASPNFKEYCRDAINGAATFVTTEPSAFTLQGYRTADVKNGVFANANWVLTFKVKCAAYFAQTGYVKFRLWRSVNADGSGATQITPNWRTSTLISFTAINQYQTGTITWPPGTTVTLTDQYLFLELEWSCAATGGNSAAAVYWVHNEGAAEKLDTPSLASSYSESISLAGTGAAGAGSGGSSLFPALSTPAIGTLSGAGVVAAERSLDLPATATLPATAVVGIPVSALLPGSAGLGQTATLTLIGTSVLGGGCSLSAEGQVVTGGQPVSPFPYITFRCRRQ